MLYFYKITFMLTLFLGTMISISSYSWLGAWMGLEIYSFAKRKKNIYSSESSI